MMADGLLLLPELPELPEGEGGMSVDDVREMRLADQA